MTTSPTKPREFYVETEYFNPDIHGGWKFYRAWSRKFELLAAAGINTIRVIEYSAYKKVIEALKCCCAPESDLCGGFVSDEFTQDSVLNGRKVLKELGEEL